MGKAWAIAGLGVTVLAAALDVLGAVWPDYIRPHPCWVIALVMVGVLMMLVPVIQRFYPIFKDKGPTLLGLDLAVENIIRTRAGGSLGRGQNADIFIQASARLRAPDFANVEYVADLIKNGVTTHSELIDDIGSWGIVERKHLDAGVIPDGGLGRDVQPLPSALSAMRKSDGWLHFRVANLSDLEITESLLRLTAASPNGMVFTERDLKGTMFNPLIFRKKMPV